MPFFRAPTTSCFAFEAPCHFEHTVGQKASRAFHAIVEVTRPEATLEFVGSTRLPRNIPPCKATGPEKHRASGSYLCDQFRAAHRMPHRNQVFESRFRFRRAVPGRKFALASEAAA